LQHILEGFEMATSAVMEPPMIPAIPMLLEPIEDVSLSIPRPQSRGDVLWGKQTPAVEESAPESVGATERKIPERRSNLGYSILLSAVEDYIGADQRNHRSARLLLYPADEQYAQHLQWVVGMTDLSMTYLRATLDRLRPQWDAERKRKR
jgi:hypothetical protein